ncbi:MAG: serine/threonine protein phosphatase [Enterovirga sp.]|jgi:serine/threonine protein phosphatase 1|nr:serine/threonine protein phosphatase [Enterovirga sp.]
MLTYAVGDIHGCRDHLADILRQIETHAAGRPRRLVFIGDYIDRGPDSAGVIATLRRLQAEPGAEVVCLMGNHEDLMLRALARPDFLDNWLFNGGDTMLASYGISAPEDLPPDVVAWVRSLPTSFEDERRCFVHAGLNPQLDRLSQRDHDRLWIRDQFLGVEHDFGKFVVHGHTPRQDGVPDLRRFRLNIDTAAVYGGRLTAAIFEDGQDGPIGYFHSPR